MKFKAAHIIKQYDILPDKLKEICESFDKISKENNISAVITRVSDPVDGESGVHLNFRAVDFRDEYFDGKVTRRLYTIETVEEIVNYINDQYPRQDERLVCIHHSFGGGPAHFHLQIPYSWLTNADKNRIKNAVT